MRENAAPPEELLDYCRRWSGDVNQIETTEKRIAYFEKELPRLLRNRPMVEHILAELVRGAGYPMRSGGMLFDNEVLLYLDRARRFSLRLYIHAPGDYTFVHDHSAWGVLGSAAGRLHVIKYRCVDDRSRRNRATLHIAGERWLSPGQTEVTLPLDAGIHKTGNAATGPLVVINVYGTPLRRLYIQRFDPETGQVLRVYPPRLHRKRLAAAALEAIRNGSTPEN